MLNKADLTLSQERQTEVHVSYLIAVVTRARKRNMEGVGNYNGGPVRGRRSGRVSLQEVALQG